MRATLGVTLAWLGVTVRTVVAVVALAIAVLAFFFLALAPLDAKLRAPFGWTLNFLHGWFSTESSWILANVLHRALFGLVVGGAIGVAVGALMGGGKRAAMVALVAILPSVGLMAWLVQLEPWLLTMLGVVACSAPAAAWLTPSFRRYRAP